jgi:hypothetical protein
MKFRFGTKYDSTYFGFLSFGPFPLYPLPSPVYQRLETSILQYPREGEGEREREKFLLRESSASTVGIAMQKRSGEGRSERLMNNFGAVDGQKAID